MEDGLDAERRGAAAATAEDGLPDDALVEILARVPSRSIHRFKCVSKRWRDLIADPLHRKRLPQTLEGFFFSDEAGGDADAGFCGCFVSLPGRSAPLVDPSFSFLTKLPGIENIKFLGYCNGLFLFQHGQNSGVGGPDYAVCNPATKQWVAVPGAGCALDPPSKVDTYLAFDPAVSPHFRLVHISQKDFLGEVEVCVYSSETRVWSDMASQQSRWRDEGGWKRWVNGGAILNPMWGSTFVNGMLHLVVYHVPDEYLIAAVDMEGKTCRIITLPDRNSFLSFFGQSQGHLHCVGSIVELERGCVKWAGLSIWVLEDYDTGEWILKHKVSFLELFGQMNCMDRFNSTVLTIHPDRNLIFILQNSNKQLLSYDMDSKELHASHTLGHNFEDFAPYVPNFLESLVLTNGH
ncbi:hypothetical protein HU200_016024 [Digitaria exilis]|uniref:F-box domain-containing protein n=1 Tax=Digitaria exilis TaxID=1010633 RepID=A0A835F997_9POAL|nr:hypothetical protein HU200_016024 [Digitaria exilis]